MSIFNFSFQENKKNDVCETVYSIVLVSQTAIEPKF